MVPTHVDHPSLREQVIAQLVELVVDLLWFAALLLTHYGMEWFVRIGHKQETWVALVPGAILIAALVKFAFELLPKIVGVVVIGIYSTVKPIVEGWRKTRALFRNREDGHDPK